MHIHENTDIDYISIQTNINKNHISKKTVEGLVDKGIEDDTVTGKAVIPR